MNKVKSLMFLGAPGVGKGTYASRIAPKLNIPAISTGDLVRMEIKNGSDIGKKMKALADSGGLVSDDIIMKIMADRLSKKDALNGYILDGFPRTLEQSIALDKVIGKIKLVVNITLEEKYLMEKLMGRRGCSKCGKNWNVANIQNEKEGVSMPPLLPKHGKHDQCECGAKLEQRADDKEHVVKHRLDIYHSHTAPLIDYYTKQGNILTFNVKKGLDDLPKLEKLIQEKLAN